MAAQVVGRGVKVGEGVTSGVGTGVAATASVAARGCTCSAGAAQPASRSRHRSRERSLIMGHLFLGGGLLSLSYPFERDMNSEHLGTAYPLCSYSMMASMLSIKKHCADSV